MYLFSIFGTGPPPPGITYPEPGSQLLAIEQHTRVPHQHASIMATENYNPLQPQLQSGGTHKIIMRAPVGGWMDVCTTTEAVTLAQRRDTPLKYC